MDTRERGRLTSIQDLLESYMKEAGLAGSRGTVARVFEAWGNAVGRELGKRVRPVRFRTGELTLEVDSSALLHEFSSFTGEEYRRRTNEILGRNLVVRTVFKQRG